MLYYKYTHQLTKNYSFMYPLTFYVDYGKLNSVFIHDSYSWLRMDDCNIFVRDDQLFSTLNEKSSYSQFEVDPFEREEKSIQFSPCVKRFHSLAVRFQKKARPHYSTS